MLIEVQTGGVRSLWSTRIEPGTLGLAWLGQAGFALVSSTDRVLIDPYLSDRLADKYRGTHYPHARLMPPPIDTSELTGVTAVLCTHRHGDHMDAGTLPVLRESNPACRFVAPAAETDATLAAGLPIARTSFVDAGESHRVGVGLTIDVLPAAHETLKQDEKGRHHFLGYVLRFAGLTLYHSGDCVPHDGLVDKVRAAKPHAALLPVNGRDDERRARGVPGNMTFAEAIRLCVDAGVDYLVPHHFGMFEFNTVDPAVFHRQCRDLPAGLSCVVPRADEWYLLRPVSEERA